MESRRQVGKRESSTRAKGMKAGREGGRGREEATTGTRIGERKEYVACSGRCTHASLPMLQSSDARYTLRLLLSGGSSSAIRRRVRCINL